MFWSCGSIPIFRSWIPAPIRSSIILGLSLRSRFRSPPLDCSDGARSAPGSEQQKSAARAPSRDGFGRGRSWPA
eukprot:3843188-Alexandrium_andersonii.AAC.1